MRKPLFPNLILRLALVQSALFLGQTVFGVTVTVTPASIINQYTGVITLQITGLNNGETVNVQKYVDANADGVVDVGDFLVQSFQLTDGQGPPAIAGVTNINIPGDLNAASGAITAQLSPAIQGIVQELVAQFAFVVSSPTSRFAPITALFNVTPSFSGQMITGAVTCNGTNVPNAVVFLINPKHDSGLNPYAGTLANNTGNFTLKVAPGPYQLAAFKYNLVTDTTKAAKVAVALGATVATNLSLLPATSSISGRLVDAANVNTGVPGITLAAQSASGLIGLSASDANGNFTLATTSSQWGIGIDSMSLLIKGYVGLNNKQGVDTSTGSVTGVTIAFPKATSLFYGSVKDSQNNPLAGVKVYADNGNNGGGAYQSEGGTDQTGHYAIGVVAGNWGLGVESSQSFYPGYVFSQGDPSWSFNNGGNGTNLTDGMAVKASFSALLATNVISGSLKDSNGQAIPNINIYAYANINGNNYNQNATTDANGNYAMNVGGGNWTVGVNCGCNTCNNSLGSKYQCLDNQSVTIFNNNGVVNFIAQLAGAYTITGSLKDYSGHPISNINIYAYANVNGTNVNQNASTDANGNYSMNVANGSWTVGVSCGCTTCNNSLGSNYQCLNNQTVTIANNNGVINFIAQLANVYIIYGAVTDAGGNPITNLSVSASGNNTLATAKTDSSGSFSLPVGNGNWNVTLDCNALSALSDLCPNGQTVQLSNGPSTINFTVQSCQTLAVTTGVTTQGLPNGMVGLPYFNNDSNGFQLQNVGCFSPFRWSITPGSLPLPAGLGLSAGGLISGVPTTAGTNNLSIRVTDGKGNTADQFMSMVVYPTALITNSSLPNGMAGVPYTVPLGTSGGADSGHFFGWNISAGSLPLGLHLTGPETATSISGTPTQIGTFSFSVSAVDNSGYQPQRTLSITIVAPSLQISTASLGSAKVGVLYTNQLQATGGANPYTWSVALGSQPLPPGLSLATNGLISGIPTASGSFTFIIRVNDANSLTTTSVLTLPVLAGVSLASPFQLSNNRFQFNVNAPTGQNYTVQYSLTLTNWVSLFSTNPLVSPFTVADVSATNQARFYRLLLGP